MIGTSQSVAASSTHRRHARRLQPGRRGGDPDGTGQRRQPTSRCGRPSPGRRRPRPPATGLQVATDAGFANLVLDVSDVADASLHPGRRPAEQHPVLLAGAGHSTRAAAGAWSSTFAFATVALPGDCGLGTVPRDPVHGRLRVRRRGLDPQRQRRQLGAVGGASAQRGQRLPRHRPAHHQRPAAGVARRWILPAAGYGADPAVLELAGDGVVASSGCWDGGVVEISTNGGATWTHLPTTVMLTDPYDGPVTGLVQPRRLVRRPAGLAEVGGGPQRLRRPDRALPLPARLRLVGQPRGLVRRRRRSFRRASPAACRSPMASRAGRRTGGAGRCRSIATGVRDSNSVALLPMPVPVPARSPRPAVTLRADSRKAVPVVATPDTFWPRRQAGDTDG